MKVCIITTVHPVFSTRIFHREAKTLVRAGYDVTLVAQHDKNEIVDGVKIVALPRPRNRFTRIFGLTWRAFRLAFRQRADIYHFHDPEFLLWGLLLQLVTRKPVIYDVHEYFPESLEDKEWLPRLLRPPLKVILGAAERLIAGRLAGVVVVNSDLARRFSHKIRPVVVLPNYPPRAFAQPDLPAPLSSTSSGDRPVLVYVGGLTEDRGITQLIRVLAQVRATLPNVQLRLVGRFVSRGYERSVRSLIASLELSEAVELIGPVPHREVPRYLKTADVGVFLPLSSSRRYAWGEPMKYFEYCAAGLPVIMSDFPVKRRLLEEVGNGVVIDPHDVQSIASAIIDLLRDPQRRKEMGQAGQRAFLESYCWEAVEGRLLALYRRLHQWRSTEIQF